MGAIGRQAHSNGFPTGSRSVDELISGTFVTGQAPYKRSRACGFSQPELFSLSDCLLENLVLLYEKATACGLPEWLLVARVALDHSQIWRCFHCRSDETYNHFCIFLHWCFGCGVVQNRGFASLLELFFTSNSDCWTSTSILSSPCFSHNAIVVEKYQIAHTSIGGYMFLT